MSECRVLCADERVHAAYAKGVITIEGTLGVCLWTQGACRQARTIHSTPRSSPTPSGWVEAGYRGLVRILCSDGVWYGYG